MDSEFDKVEHHLCEWTRRAFRSFGEVQHSKSGFIFYLIFLRSWIHFPVAKTVPEIPSFNVMLYAKLDSRPARTGFEVGSSMDTINKRTLVDMGVILSLENGDK